MSSQLTDVRVEQKEDARHSTSDGIDNSGDKEDAVDSLAVAPCEYCLRSPCVTKQRPVPDFLIYRSYDVEGVGMEALRYAAYRGAVYYLYGPGCERTKLPDCIVSKIRTMYPDPTGGYTGFLPSTSAPPSSRTKRKKSDSLIIRKRITVKKKQ